MDLGIKSNISVKKMPDFNLLSSLAVPTILVYTLNVEGANANIENQLNVQILSDILAFLLLAVYIAGIIFTFFTHKHLFPT